MVLVIMDDVVQGDGLERLEHLHLDLLLSVLQVRSILFDLLYLVIAQHKGRDSGGALEVRISIILEQEGAMIDDGALGQSLNDEEFFLDTLVVRDGNLNDSILNEVHLLNYFILLANVASLLAGDSLHVEYQLLLRLHGEVSEVGDLVHLKLNKSQDAVIILEHVLLE